MDLNPSRKRGKEQTLCLSTPAPFGSPERFSTFRSLLTSDHLIVDLQGSPKNPATRIYVIE